MEPNENNGNRADEAKTREQEQAARADLRAEGIDIVGPDDDVRPAAPSAPLPKKSINLLDPELPENQPKKQPLQQPAARENPDPNRTVPDAFKAAGFSANPASPKPTEREGLKRPEPVHSSAPNLQGEISSMLGASTAPFSEKSAKNDPSIKPIRTFKSDAEEAIRYQNVSTIDIAVAAEKKRQASTPIEYEADKKSSAGIFVLIVFLVIAAIGAGWYYWFVSSKPQAAEEAAAPAAQIRTIIPYAQSSSVVVDKDSNPMDLIAAKLAISNPGLGNVAAAIPVESAGASQLAPIASVFGNTNMPSRLERSLSDEYMFGLYVYDSNSPFIILKNTFFQNAYAGMLEWEKKMKDDLLPLIRIPKPGETIAETGTDRFEDMVVSNVDTRALRNDKGDIVLAYAFADKDTIVITTSINSLKYLLDRVLAVRTIQ